MTRSETASPLAKEAIAAMVARDIPAGSFVNLGIGLPTLVSDFLEAGSGVTLHTENGMLGMGPAAVGDEYDPDLVNAGKIAVTELPGAAYFNQAESFAMMRGGHIDVCVMGAFEVSVARRPRQLVNGGARLDPRRRRGDGPRRGRAKHLGDDEPLHQGRRAQARRAMLAAPHGGRVRVARSTRTTRSSRSVASDPRGAPRIRSCSEHSGRPSPSWRTGWASRSRTAPLKEDRLWAPNRRRSPSWGAGLPACSCRSCSTPRESTTSCSSPAATTRSRRRSARESSRRRRPRSWSPSASTASFARESATTASPCASAARTTASTSRGWSAGRSTSIRRRRSSRTWRRLGWRRALTSAGRRRSRRFSTAIPRARASRSRTPTGRRARCARTWSWARTGPTPRSATPSRSPCAGRGRTSTRTRGSGSSSRRRAARRSWCTATPIAGSR